MKRVESAAESCSSNNSSIKKKRTDEFLPHIINSLPPAAEDNDNLFWQLYIAQLEKLNKIEKDEEKDEKPREKKTKRRIQWTGFYRRKTDEYEVDLPLDYHRVKVLKSTDDKLTLSATHKVTGDIVIVRRVNCTDNIRIQRLFRTLMLHRLIATDNVMRPCEMYIREGYIYTIAEAMECQLREIVENPSTHFCVSRVVHQLLVLLCRMHSMGITHGSINTSNVYFDGDMSIKVANFGHSMEESDKLFNECNNQDLIAVRSILAKLLLIASPDDRRLDDDDDELDWKCLLESTEELGLTDENARDLLDSMFENKYSSEKLLKHDYFKSFKVFEFEPECGELDLSMKKPGVLLSNIPVAGKTVV